jgi:hypothetical protein
VSGSAGPLLSVTDTQILTPISTLFSSSIVVAGLAGQNLTIVGSVDVNPVTNIDLQMGKSGSMRLGAIDNTGSQGAILSLYSDQNTVFRGGLFLDAGFHPSASIIFRTAGVERFRVSGSDGSIYFSAPISGTLTVSDIAVQGKLVASGSQGILGQFLTSTGAGVKWNSVTQRTVTTFTATAGQTAFVVSYTVGAVDVFLNGVRLTAGDYAANNGSNITLTVPAFSGDIIDVVANGTSPVAIMAPRSVVPVTTPVIADHTTATVEVFGFKSYVLMKATTSDAAWVRLYTDSGSRASDASRPMGVDPVPGSGVIAEIITTGNQSIPITPFVFGGNLDNSVVPTIYIAVTNLSGVTKQITTTLTLLQLEG